MIRFQIDRATVDKAQLFEQALNNLVVLVGVWAQMRTLPKGPVDAAFSDAFFRAVAGDAMDHPIRAVVQPSSACNGRIGRFYVLSENEEERPDDPAIFDADIAVSLCDTVTLSRIGGNFLQVTGKLQAS